jgi:hypothetical protein
MNMRKRKYVEELNFQLCNEATKYETVAKIGQVAYG